MKPHLTGSGADWPKVASQMVDLAQSGIEFIAEVFREGKTFVALCPELGVSSFGPTPMKAQEALKEAIAAFVEGCAELGTLDVVMKEAGFSKQGGKWVSRTPLSHERLTAAL